MICTSGHHITSLKCAGMVGVGIMHIRLIVISCWGHLVRFVVTVLLVRQVVGVPVERDFCATDVLRRGHLEPRGH